MLIHKLLSEQKLSVERLIRARLSRLFSAISLALLLALIPVAPSQAGGARSTAHSPATENLPHTSSQSFFEPPRTLPAGFEAEALAVGDFNNDQVPDIVATTSQSSVTVLLGQGGGDFAPPVEFDLGRRPSSLALADFNSDGNLDIAAASYMHDGVMVLSGDGEGDFSGLLAIDVSPGTGGTDPASPVAMVAEDFNHDGAVDIATLNRNSGDVSLLTGNGQGQFSSPANYPSGEAFGSLQVGDFNDDGWADLATSDPSTITFLLNEEGVGFGNPLNITVAVSSSVIAVADFDSDGIDDDVVVVTQSSAAQPYRLRAYLGDRGGGNFNTSESPLNEQIAALTSLAVGDTNGDGAPDLVAVYRSANKVVVLENRGGGQFAEQASYAIADNGNGVTLADLDGDGALDLLIGTNDGVQVFRGSVSGNVTAIDSSSLELWLEAGVTTGERDVLADRSGNQNNGKFYNFDDPGFGYHTSDDPPVRAWTTFDGVNDYIGAQEQVASLDVMTMSVWFRTTSPYGKVAGFENSIVDAGSLNDRHLYVDGDGHLRFGAYNGNSVMIRTQEPITDGEWHHAVATMDPSSGVAEIALYLDGNLQETAVAGSFTSYQGYWRVGGGNHSRWPGWGSNNFFKGDIGSLRIYNVAASPAEARLLFDSTAAQPIPTPVPGGDIPDPIIWLNAAERGDDPGVLTDLSGHRNDGTLNNFDDIEAAFGGDGAPPVPSHITFDGVDDFISTKTLMEAPRNFSLAVWFRTTEATGKIAGFHSSATGASDDFDRHLYIDTNGLLRFGVQRAGESIHLMSMLSMDPVTDGEWHLAVGTVQVIGSQVAVRLYLDGIHQSGSEVEPIRNYFGYWRLGGGDIGSWPGIASEYFKGDIGEFMLYDVALSEEQVAILSGIAEPTPTAVPTTTAPPEEEESDPEPGVSISSNIDGETLTLDVTFSNVPDLEQSTVYVVREDGTEFLVGPGAARLSWTGEAVTGLYRVEARVASGGDGQAVLASSTVPVLAPISTPTEIGVAVGVGVAVAAASSAAAASGFSAYDFIVRLLKIVVLEKMRKKTRRVDIKRLPSWIAAVLAIVLMAVFLTLARPGALEFRSFGEAFVIATTASVMFRSFTLAGGIFLAFITGQKPRYLLWLAGTASFAITGIFLHAPFGYTGYMDRKPGNVHRNARFAVAGYSVVFSMAGVFLLVGSLTDLAFAETGITLVFSALAASMLPFPFMGGNALWKWKKPAGVASAIIGLTLYSLFMYGKLPLGAIYTLAALGFPAFAAIMIADRLIMKREEREESAATEPELAAEATPVTLAEPEASTDASAATPEESEDGPAPAVAPIAPTAQVITPRGAATPAADSSATPDKSL